MANQRYNARMSMTERLVEAINAKRQAGLLTVNQLAESTGIHRVRLSELLNRKQQTCTLDAAAKICEAADLSLDEICWPEKVIAR